MPTMIHNNQRLLNQVLTVLKGNHAWERAYILLAMDAYKHKRLMSDGSMIARPGMERDVASLVARYQFVRALQPHTQEPGLDQRRLDDELRQAELTFAETMLQR